MCQCQMFENCNPHMNSYYKMLLLVNQLYKFELAYVIVSILSKSSTEIGKNVFVAEIASDIKKNKFVNLTTLQKRLRASIIFATDTYKM